MRRTCQPSNPICCQCSITNIHGNYSNVQFLSKFAFLDEPCSRYTSNNPDQEWFILLWITKDTFLVLKVCFSTPFSSFGKHQNAIWRSFGVENLWKIRYNVLYIKSIYWVSTFQYSFHAYLYVAYLCLAEFQADFKQVSTVSNGELF